jgi:hypothetical protein
MRIDVLLGFTSARCYHCDKRDFKENMEKCCPRFWWDDDGKHWCHKACHRRALGLELCPLCWGDAPKSSVARLRADQKELATFRLAQTSKEKKRGKK